MRATAWPRRRSFRNPLGAVLTLIAIAMVAGVAALLWPPEPALSGQARAVDGDTLRIDDTRVRLIGLDAVEFDQICTDSAGTSWACGKSASAFLRALVKDGTTSCTTQGRDRYRRVLAHCANGGDLGDKIVRAGWATAELEYGLALADARLNGRGIWSGHFDDPADWRRNHGDETFDLWAWLMGLLGR